MAEPERDDGKRGEIAVGVSVRRELNGRYRLIVDDLLARSADRYPDWRTYCFVTSGTVAREELVDLTLSDQRVLEFGRLILSRLAAVLSVREGPHPE